MFDRPRSNEASTPSEPRHENFSQTPNRLIDEHARTLGFQTVAVYNLLLRNAAGRSFCSLPYKVIAATLGIHRSTAIREVKKLADNGLLRLEKSGNRPNKFHLLLLPKPKDQGSSPATPNKSQGRPSATPGSSAGDRRVAHRLPQTLNNTNASTQDFTQEEEATSSPADQQLNAWESMRTIAPASCPEWYFMWALDLLRSFGWSRPDDPQRMVDWWTRHFSKHPAITETALRDALSQVEVMEPRVYSRPDVLRALLKALGVIDSPAQWMNASGHMAGITAFAARS